MKKILYLCTLLLLLASCSSSKQNIVLMSDTQGATTGKLPLRAPELIVQPDDELAITVTAEVPQAAAPYNLPLNVTSTKTDLTSSSFEMRRLQTYRVNKEGDINFPILGKLHVSGLTTSGIADMLVKRISENVENPVVVVELMNFQVKVTGDVKKPQIVPSTKEQMTVIDAIAAAEDINVTGRRDNVLVIREINGETVYHRIDLTNSKTWDPEFYYLRQNDVVYVEPGPARIDELTYNQRRSFNVTLASVIVSSCSVLVSMVIALAIK